MPAADPEVRTTVAAFAARSRLVGLDADARADMTADARAAKAANYLERVKDEIDPDRRLSEQERTWQAENLVAARAHQRQLAKLRREQRLRALADLADALDLVEPAEARAS